ncbi:MAG: right-handed parallel beta-helix repeat-containing protein [Armatimonadetes bacterium]|nr:right-handed parallel beta-helix repeat-containing protein [Armatimonadota bacterium]
MSVQMILVFCLMLPLVLSGSRSLAAEYYADSRQGSDANTGRSPGEAWKSLAPLNRATFGPGDRIWLAAGSRFEGQWSPLGSGSREASIRVDIYGGKAKARIDAGGRHEAALKLRNVEYWSVRNLELTNDDPERGKRRYGALIQAENCGTLHGIHLSRLYIHDVRGSLIKNDREEGFGILWENWGDRMPSRFDGLRIERCHLLRCDRSGIGGWSGHQDRRPGRWFPSLNVVIRHNRLVDTGGDCIKPEGCDGALVEYNRVDRGRQRCKDAAAGIWPWASDNTIIQKNEVSGLKGTFDGQAFDSDDNCRNTLFQYNYSHDNDGGFILICSVGRRVEEGQVTYVGLENTVVRYNISQNDGGGGEPPYERRPRVIHIAGPARNTRIHNNVFFIGKDFPTYFIHNTPYMGMAEDVYLYNNIIYAKGELKYDLGQNTRFDFRKNVFFGNHIEPPAGPEALTGDPMLAGVGTGKSGLASLSGYKLRAGSPCIGTAMPVPSAGRRDFWGNPLPPGGPSCVGAHEFGTADGRGDKDGKER